MAGGRPREYSDVIPRKAREYLNTFKDLEQVIPTLASLSLFLKVNRDTVHTWAKEEDKEEFSDIVKEILAKQEEILANKGLSGDFNAPVAKMMLAKHGYSDAVKSEVTLPEGVIFNMNFGGKS